MENKYIYQVETFTTSRKEIQIPTLRARIRLLPDSKKNNELRTAVVCIKGPHIFENFYTARRELAKVVLRHLGVNSSIITEQGFLPQKWVTHRGKTVDLTQGMDGTTENLRAVLRESHNHPRLHNRLRIDVNSDSPALECYYEALRREYPIDRYREMYKIIEYFSGVKPSNDTPRDKKHIVDHLDYTWWIGDSALEWATSHFQRGITRKELAEKLVEYRSECSHMRPNYGLKPSDTDELSRIVNIIPILDEIVKYTLQRHPDTRAESRVRHPPPEMKQRTNSRQPAPANAPEPEPRKL